MIKERFVVPNAEWLLITEDGEGFSSRTGEPYKPEITHDGYLRYRATVNGKGCRFSAHRAVALVFLENPSNLPTVNHKNGIKTDNRVSNLEWRDFSYQQRHAVVSGLKPNTKKGKDCCFTKYEEGTIHEICELLQKGLRNCEIRDILPDVHPKTISNIRTGKSWVEISQNYTYPTSRKKAFSKETVQWVIDRFKEGLSPQEVSVKTCSKVMNLRDITKMYDKFKQSDLGRPLND